MPTPCSPLRYPGGKQTLAPLLAHLIQANGREECVYAEPYAGGAGAALALLFGEYVRELMLNDADTTIYAFWIAVLDHADRFAKLVADTPLTVQEWDRQRRIYHNPSQHSIVRLGFATFYLNRCNRSGIIGNGGIIGGRGQDGPWKLDARYSRSGLVRRIEKIASYRDRIKFFNEDAITFLKKRVTVPSIRKKVFVYLDPPYFKKGNQLYLNYYEPSDHEILAKYLMKQKSVLWVLSYDNVPEVRKLYSSVRRLPFRLDYSARDRRKGNEILILPKHVTLPKDWRADLPPRHGRA